MKILKIKETASLARHEQHRFSPMAVYLELHIPVQMIAIMLKILDLHFLSPKIC